MAYDYHQEPAYCATCGTEAEPGSRYCANCGAVIDPLGDSGPSYAPGGYYLPPGADAPVVEYMGFWIRLAAALIDGVLLGIVNFIVGWALGLGENPVAGLLNLAITWAYHVAFIAARGQTIGKMLLGIQVVDYRGSIPGIGSVLLRETVGKLLSLIALFIGYLWAAWDPEKRAWHDHIAGTWVVWKEQAPDGR